MVGIYKIENTINNKVYIGQSTDIDKRWKSHKESLRNNRHSNAHLQDSYNKYGSSIFIYSILEECSERDLTDREQYWIDYYGGIDSDQNYNMKGASSAGKLNNDAKLKISKALKGKFIGSRNPYYGKHHSKEVINKIKLKRSYQIITDEHKHNISLGVRKAFDTGIPQKNISKALKGKKKNLTDEYRNKLRDRMNEIRKLRTYHPLSDELKERIRKSNIETYKKRIQNGDKWGNKGMHYKFSEESRRSMIEKKYGKGHITQDEIREWKNNTIYKDCKTVGEKLSIANKGKKLSNETKEKIRQAHIGMRLSDETKQKISDANRGRKASDELKERLSRARKGSNNANSKISKEDALFVYNRIINENLGPTQFKKEYGLSFDVYYDIKRKEHWCFRDDE